MPVLGGSAICLLGWQLWRAQRHYALELAEQSRHVAEAREQTTQALQEREAFIRESQAKSEMLATLSREIRSHLNGIMGSADLMLDHSLKPAQREHLITLRSSAESLHQSLNDVLDYSNIETGQIEIASTPFDLRQPLIEVVEHFSPQALLKGLELVLIIAPDVPLNLSGDAARLRQVLLNLMSNAVRFTATGRVVLHVELSAGSASPSKQGATWIHFTVRDTGAGIPEDMQATIFDRFPSSDSTSPRKFGGSGLELAISKRLVELMGGTIGARSLPESGSEFWAVLPLPAEKIQLPTAAPQVDDLHVVVLDDLSASRVAVSALLARLGIDQDATDTVAKAAELLRDAQETGARELVLLLDESVVPDSAAGLMRMLGADSALRPTRVVLMARDPAAVAAAEFEFPVAAVLRKPLLRAENLLEVLRPAAAAGALKPADSRAPFEAGGGVRPTLREGPLVLVVDDDEISRSVTAQLLARLGCAVDQVVSGPEAIDRAQRSIYHLILMECQMPDMDGFQTTEQIRTLAGNKAPPIVALMANTSMRDRERCFAAGMCDFVGKPARKTELAAILKRWVRSEAIAAK